MAAHAPPDGPRLGPDSLGSVRFRSVYWSCSELTLPPSHPLMRAALIDTKEMDTCPTPTQTGSRQPGPHQSITRHDLLHAYCRPTADDAPERRPSHPG